jgi:hypothetical protein
MHPRPGWTSTWGRSRRICRRLLGRAPVLCVGTIDALVWHHGQRLVNRCDRQENRDRAWKTDCLHGGRPVRGRRSDWGGGCRIPRQEYPAKRRGNDDTCPGDHQDRVAAMVVAVTALVSRRRGDESYDHGADESFTRAEAEAVVVLLASCRSRPR